MKQHNSSLQNLPRKPDLGIILLTVIYSIFLLVVPMVPDVQIIRPKLLIIELLVYIVTLIVLVRTVILNKFYYRSAYFNIPSLFFVSYIILQYIFSLDKSLASVELKRWMLSFTVAYSVSIIGEEYVEKLYPCWIIGSGLAVIYGLLQHSGGIWRIQVPKMDRVMSMFGNPIFFAVHIINFLPVMVAVWISYVKKKNIIKIFLLVLIILALVTLYYTKTRAAFIGFGISMLVFIYFTIKSKRKLFYLIGVIVGFILFVIFSKNIWLRQQAHILIWRDTLKMWSTRPFTGVGLGKFHTEFVNFASEQLRKIWPQKQCIINDAHNEYIQLAAETGLIGIGLFISMIGFFFYEVINRLLKTNKIIIVGLLCGIISVLVQNFFSVDMRFIISSVYLFFSIGMVSNYMFVLKEKKLIFANKYIKFITIVVLLFILGIFTFERQVTPQQSPEIKFSIMSLIHISKKGIEVGIEDFGNGLLQHILRPYLAQKKLSQEKDFFDEKIVDAAKSLQELEELKNKYPNKSIIYEKIAWIYAKEKNFNKAIENYLIAIKLNPNSFAAYNNLGNIMFYINRNEAIKFYQQSIRINPNQIDARLNLGIAYYYEGKLNLAAEQFNEVLKIDPKNEKALVMLKKMRE